jgi:hypothetical protein
MITTETTQRKSNYLNKAYHTYTFIDGLWWCVALMTTYIHPTTKFSGAIGELMKRSELCNTVKTIIFYLQKVISSLLKLPSAFFASENLRRVKIND